MKAAPPRVRYGMALLIVYCAAGLVSVKCQVRRTRPADGRRAEVNVRFHIFHARKLPVR
jgi:hypothetical protein